MQTQRLLVIFVLINLMVGMALAISSNPSNYDASIIDNRIQTLEEQGYETIDIYDNTPVQTDVDKISQASVGNPISAGRIIVETFKNSVGILFLDEDIVRTDAEKVFVAILKYLQYFIILLGGLEIFKLIFNRKAT